MILSASGPAVFLFFISSFSSHCVFSLPLHVSPILPVYRLADIKNEKFMRSFSGAFRLHSVYPVPLYPCRVELLVTVFVREYRHAQTSSPRIRSDLQQGSVPDIAASQPHNKETCFELVIDPVTVIHARDVPNFLDGRHTPRAQT